MSLTVISKQSYDKLTNTYKNYFLETSEKFANYFTKQLNHICLSSYEIADDSRYPNKVAFRLDPSALENCGFSLYPATQTIAEYAKSTPDFFGIYYYDIDRVLTSSSSFTSQTFASDYLETSGNQKLAEFFSKENTGLTYYSCNLSGKYGSLLVGVQTKLGQSHQLALLIYKLDNSFIDTSLLMTNDPSVVQFSVLDENRQPLISFGPNYYDGTLSFPVIMGNHINEEDTSFTFQADSKKYIACIYKEPTTGFAYMLTSPLDQVMNGTQEFYLMNMKILFLLCAILLVSIVLMIYINYRPVVGLLKKLNKNGKATNEFETISDEINRMTNEISEQNIVIVDSLLGNILYGIPISEEMVKRIGVPLDSCCYFVFTLSSGNVNTTQRTEITAELLSHFSTKVYITDILFQDITVLICMSASDRKAQIFKFLTMYFKLGPFSKTGLRQGITVSSLNDIKFSFSSCFSAPPGKGQSLAASWPVKNDFLPAQDSTSQLMQRIAQYIENRFTDPSLSQSSVADYFQISTYSLSRLFKSKFGVLFTEYVTRKRIRMAQKLLTESDSPVSTVAVQVGIPNVNYFYKVFKAYTGTSPLKYRNSLRESSKSPFKPCHPAN
jgi:AraC-like DNA-binding protein